MSLTLTHFPINPLIKQPEPGRRKRILTSGLHDQIFLTHAVA